MSTYPYCFLIQKSLAGWAKHFFFNESSGVLKKVNKKKCRTRQRNNISYDRNILSKNTGMGEIPYWKLQ